MIQKQENWELPGIQFQGLGYHVSTAGDMGSILGQATKILHATRHGKKIEKKKKEEKSRKIRDKIEEEKRWIYLRLQIQKKKKTKN